MLFLKDVGYNSLLSRWGEKGGVKRGRRGKTELLLQLQSMKEGFSFFFLQQLLSQTYISKYTEQAFSASFYAKRFLLKDRANYRACIYPVLGACLACIYISWASALPEACRTLFCLQWRAPVLQKQQWLKQNAQTDETPWIYLPRQPGLIPFNAGWHLDALSEPARLTCHWADEESKLLLTSCTSCPSAPQILQSGSFVWPPASGWISGSHICYKCPKTWPSWFLIWCNWGQISRNSALHLGPLVCCTRDVAVGFFDSWISLKFSSYSQFLISWPVHTLLVPELTLDGAAFFFVHFLSPFSLCSWVQLGRKDRSFVSSSVAKCIHAKEKLPILGEHAPSLRSNNFHPNILFTKEKKRSILDKLEMFEKQPFPFVHFPLKKTEPTAVCWTSGENLINFEENIDRYEGKGFIFFLPPEKIGQSSSPFSCMNEQNRQSRWTKSFRLILWWPSLFHWFPADSLFAGHP